MAESAERPADDSDRAHAYARGTPSEDWKQRFVEAMAVLPVVRAACEVAGVSRTTAYKHRGEDPDFAAAWDEAREDGIDRAVQEAIRRGVTGYSEPVYGPVRDEHGNPAGHGVVGDIRKYSDTLLLRVLEANRPEYRRHFVLKEEGSGVDAEIRKLAEELQGRAQGAPVPSEE